MFDISFNRLEGGLGRKATGNDHVTALLFYTMGITMGIVPQLDCTSLEQAVTQGLVRSTMWEVYYHVAEFFRKAPGARLIVKNITTATTTYADLRTLQAEKEGVIKQFGIWDGTQAVTPLRLTAINDVCAAMAADNMPAVAVLSPMVTPATLATLPDLSTTNAPNVAVVIAHDTLGIGYATTSNPQVGIIGATLGAMATMQVHTSLQWVGKNNMVTTAYKNANGTIYPTRELDNLGFLGNTAYNTLTLAQVNAIDAKGYMFLRKHVDYAGSYFNHSRAATTTISDYAFIEASRTMHKGCRAVYKDLLPYLGSPAFIDDATGFITEASVASFEEIASAGLAQMQRDGEISGFLVVIDAQQPILTTGKLYVQLRIVPTGTLREIIVNIGFTLKLNN